MPDFDEVVRFHGHACPGLALGFRVGLLALGRLGPRPRDEELVAVVENNSCAVDAIQVLTGCTFGKGNLIFRDLGKQVYTFFSRPQGEALRIVVSWQPPPESAAETEAWVRYAAGDRSPAVTDLVQQRKSRKLAAILAASEAELLTVRTVVADPPPPAVILPSRTCQRCGEQVMETRARVREGRIVCIPCAGEGRP
ncbi:MAG: FmdE family protein [Thermodesulfobacteriota bacterium]